jgi:acetyl esterase/lipase
MGAFRVPQGFVRLGARLTSRRALDPGLPWQVQRRRLGRLARIWPLTGGKPAVTTTLKGIPAEVHAGGGTAAVTVVHFHGGGYCVGSPGESRDWAAHVSAQAGCRIFLPDYRLAPEHPYPAGLDDARAALEAVLADSAAGTVIVSGDSAGGGLALILAQEESAAREKPRLAGCMLMSPWLDLTADWTGMTDLARRDVVLSPDWLEACAQAYAGEQDRSQPAISPLYGDLAGLPPLLIQCGTDDLVAPDADRLKARARAAGADVTCTRWPRLWHNFPLQPELIAAADAAVAQTVAFIARVSGTADLGRVRGLAPHFRDDRRAGRHGDGAGGPEAEALIDRHAPGLARLQVGGLPGLVHRGQPRSQQQARDAPALAGRVDADRLQVPRPPPASGRAPTGSSLSGSAPSGPAAARSRHRGFPRPRRRCRRRRTGAPRSRAWSRTCGQAGAGGWPHPAAAIRTAGRRGRRGPARRTACPRPRALLDAG